MQHRLSIIVDICKGANYLHRGKGAAAYHRDFKPSNIGLSHDGEVKILDWGLSHYHPDNKVPGFTNFSLIPSTKGIFGTRGYVSVFTYMKPLYRIIFATNNYLLPLEKYVTFVLCNIDMSNI